MHGARRRPMMLSRCGALAAPVDRQASAPLAGSSCCAPLIHPCTARAGSIPHLRGGHVAPVPAIHPPACRAGGARLRAGGVAGADPREVPGDREHPGGCLHRRRILPGQPGGPERDGPLHHRARSVGRVRVSRVGLDVREGAFGHREVAAIGHDAVAQVAEAVPPVDQQRHVVHLDPRVALRAQGRGLSGKRRRQRAGGGERRAVHVHHGVVQAHAVVGHMDAHVVALEGTVVGVDDRPVQGLHAESGRRVRAGCHLQEREAQHGIERSIHGAINTRTAALRAPQVRRHWYIPTASENSTRCTWLHCGSRSRSTRHPLRSRTSNWPTMFCAG